jgi:hypothetical protein
MKSDGCLCKAYVNKDFFPAKSGGMSDIKNVIEGNEIEGNLKETSDLLFALF